MQLITLINQKGGAGHSIIIIKSSPIPAIIMLNIIYYIGYRKRISRNAIKGILRAFMAILLFLGVK